MSIEIVSVKENKTFKDFLNLTKEIYKDNKTAILPLTFHVRMMIGDIQKADKHLLVAKKIGKVVARLAIKKHLQYSKGVAEESLHFGFFEAHPNEFEVVKKLFETAHKLYPKLNMKGPYHFRMEDPYIGLLKKGFEDKPYFLMSYNPPYYRDYFDKLGFKNIMDLFTYEVTDSNNLPNSIKQNAYKAIENGVKIRTLNMKNLNQEARTIATIFNDALSKNWGFEEFDEAQINEMVMLLKYFIDPRVVIFAQVEEKDVGCLLMIPNYNEIIDGDGSISAKIIWKFLRRKKLINSIRGYALGVLSKYHSQNIGSLLTHSMFEVGPKIGYTKCEISWVLSNNESMNSLAEAMGGKHSKVYEIIEKPALQ